MKALSILLILSTLFLMTGCGKNNESGKNNNGVCLNYNVNGSCSSYSSYSVGYSGTTNLSGIVSAIPCESSIYGYSGTGIARTQQTFTVPTRTIATAGQSYLGVTSMGDIAILVGTGGYTAQMTVFLCPGQSMSQLESAVMLGEYATATCPIKTITAASFGMVAFRDPRYGRGLNRIPFQFCY